MKLAVAFLLGALASICFQGKTADWLVVPVYAFHMDRGIYCNDLATGVGWERTDTQVAYSAGVYRNSNCGYSLWATKCWLPLRLGTARGGACAGAVTGYSSPITPAGAFVLTYERPTWGLNAIMVPPMGESSPGVIWFQWKKPW